MEPYTLTKEHLARSVLQALEDKRLGFHMPDNVRGRYGCRYDYAPEGHAGYQCAVGCALSEEVRQRIVDNSLNASTLDILISGYRQEKPLLAMDKDTEAFALGLQKIHDDVSQTWLHYDGNETHEEAAAIELLRQKCLEVLKDVPCES